MMSRTEADMKEILNKEREAIVLSDVLHPHSLSTQELFRHGNTVRIEHAGQTYWLRLTRGNKLILTK